MVNFIFLPKVKRTKYPEILHEKFNSIRNCTVSLLIKIMDKSQTTITLKTVKEDRASRDRSTNMGTQGKSILGGPPHPKSRIGVG